MVDNEYYSSGTRENFQTFRHMCDEVCYSCRFLWACPTVTPSSYSGEDNKIIKQQNKAVPPKKKDLKY